MPWVGSHLWTIRQKIGHDLVVIPGSGVVILNKAGQVLLTHRTDMDLWCMPGGVAEPHSTFLSTAAQEVLEEIGVQVAPEKLTPFAALSNYEEQFTHYPNGDEAQAFSLFFVLKDFEGAPQACDEVREVRFFDSDKMPPNLMPGAKAAWRAYQAYEKTGQFQYE